MAELDAIRITAVFAADSQLDARARVVSFFNCHRNQLADTGLVDRSERVLLDDLQFRYRPRKEPESSRLMPRHVCVRSLVPKLKNSAV